MFFKKTVIFSAILSTALLGGCLTKTDIHAQPVASVSKNSYISQMQLDSKRMMAHLHAFSDIAQNNQGNRAVGTQGGLRSRDYIVALAKQAGYKVQLQSFQNREKVQGTNIIVEISGKSTRDSILVGAHYDSVKMGPGINDNASGVAVLLEIMQQFATQKIQPKNTLQLAFWDSEEEGIAGSRAYVQQLTAAQLKTTKAYINLDMVGTQKPEVLVLDADRSTVDELEQQLKQSDMQAEDYQAVLSGLRAIPSHAGDLALEKALNAFYRPREVQPKEDLSILTASDTAPFLGKLPVAMISYTHEQMQGDELEFIPCYHKSCDRIDKVDAKSMQLAAHAVLHLLNSIEQLK